MKAQHFLAWMDAVGATTAVQVSEKLGLSRETGRKAVESAKLGEEVKVKKTVALAMTSLANSLKPWDAYER